MVSMSFFMLLSILIIITLNTLINCLSPFLLVLLENSLVLSFGTCFFIFPFRLPLCVCFYVLGRTHPCLRQTLSVTGPGEPVSSYQQSIQLVSPSAGPGYAQKEPGCIPRPPFTSIRPVGGSANASAPRDLSLPEGFLLGLKSESLPAVLFSNRA